MRELELKDAIMKNEEEVKDKMTEVFNQAATTKPRRWCRRSKERGTSYSEIAEENWISERKILK